MSDIDPTVYPPSWLDGGQYDHEQHKVMTEHGLLDFLGNEVREVGAIFREWEAGEELPPEVKEFRKILESQVKHTVRVRDIGLASKWEALELAAATPGEVTSEKCIFHGVSALVATNITVIDQNSGQASTANPVGTWGAGPAAPPVWLDRGITLRRGLWIASSVATTVSVYWREWDED